MILTIHVSHDIQIAHVDLMMIYGPLDKTLIQNFAEILRMKDMKLNSYCRLTIFTVFKFPYISFFISEKIIFTDLFCLILNSCLR